MLQEVIECVGRFSPWYKTASRALSGLTSIRDAKTGRVKWMLAPEAVQRWQGVLHSAGKYHSQIQRADPGNGPGGRSDGRH